MSQKIDNFSNLLTIKRQNVTFFLLKNAALYLSRETTNERKKQKQQQIKMANLYIYFYLKCYQKYTHRSFTNNVRQVID